MTFFTLVRHVEYEGGDLQGNFASLDAVFAHLAQLEGWMMDGWEPDTEEIVPLEPDEVYFPSASTGWELNAPGDISFRIYACSLEAA